MHAMSNDYVMPLQCTILIALVLGNRSGIQTELTPCKLEVCIEHIPMHMCRDYLL